MDLLFVVPHLWSDRGGGDHGSSSDGREGRAAKLARVVAGLHDTFPARTVEIAHDRRRSTPCRSPRGTACACSW